MRKEHSISLKISEISVLHKVIFAMATVLLCSKAWAADELATPPQAFDSPDRDIRVAQFGIDPFHVGVCRMRGARITMNRDGRVFFLSQVRTRKPNGIFPVLKTRLIFIDRNNQRLFVMPFIARSGLKDDWANWERTNLAIPEHLYPFITAVVRNDRCED